MKNIKQVCTLLFLLFSACMFGQGHIMEIKNLMPISDSETLRVSAVSGDGTTLDLITVRNGVVRYQSPDPDDDSMVASNPNLYRIDPNFTEIGIEYEYIFYYCPPRICTVSQRYVVTNKFSIDIDENQCYINQSFNEEFKFSIPYGDTTADVEVELGFDYEIVPFLTVANAVESQLAGYEHPLQVVATPSGLEREAYQWEYQLRDYGSEPRENGWRNLPEDAMGNSSPNHMLSVVPMDFLDVSAIDRELFFRVNPCGSEIPSESDFTSFILRRSAPRIIGSETDDVTCYDSEDGQVRVYFERQLYLDKNERLSFSIIDTNIGESVPTTIDEDLDERFRGPNNIAELLRNSNGYYYDFKGIPASIYDIQIVTGEEEMDEDDPARIYYSGGEDHFLRDIEINRPTAVRFTIDRITDVKCRGGSDGRIRISASGGSSDGSYVATLVNRDDRNNVITVPFSNNSRHEFTGLEEGEYKINVFKNVRGEHCYSENGETDWLEVDEPSSSVQIEVTEMLEPRGYEREDGRITALITGGTGEYSIRWRKNGSTSTGGTRSYSNGYATLDGITAGTYTLEVRDANYGDASNNDEDRGGCIYITEPIVLEQPPEIEIEVEREEPSCHEDNNGDRNETSDGVLRIRVSGGVPYTGSDNDGMPYSYRLSSISIEDFGPKGRGSYRDGVYTISELTRGTYILYITDANDVTKTNFVRLDGPDAITVDPVLTHVNCNGGNDGVIDLNIAGGVGPYTIEWTSETTPKFTVNNERVTGLYAGGHNAVITDSNNCTVNVGPYVLSEPATYMEISLPLSEQPRGAGQVNGWVEARVQGGTTNNGTYNYTWENSDGNNLNAQTSASLDESTGEYVIRLSNIGAGNYVLIVTDDNGCQEEKSFIMEEPDPLNVEIEVLQTISCNGANELGDPFADGALEAYASGGVPFNEGNRYIFTWKKQDIETGEWEIIEGETESMITGLATGNYAVNVEDSNGVVMGNFDIETDRVIPIDKEFYLDEPPLLEISFINNRPLCFGGSDGSLTAIPSGGTGDYISIVWNTNNYDTTWSIDGLTSGTYEATVTDSNGCQAITSVELLDPEPITVTYSAYGRPSTIGAGDAWLEATITGGAAFEDGTYIYDWQDEEGNVLNPQTVAPVTTVNDSTVFQVRLNDIPAGKYFLTVTDKNYALSETNQGCMLVDHFFEMYNPIEASISIHTPISCNAGNEFLDPSSDGKLIADVNGGKPFSDGQPYKYIWKRLVAGGLWEVIEGQDTEIVSGLNAGTYALNVEDSRGEIIGVYESYELIQATDEVFEFEEPELLQVEVIGTEVSCESGNDGTATAVISGGIGDYTIEWSTGETTPLIQNLKGGTYIVYVTDSRGCKATGQVIIDQPGGINIEITEKVQPVCYGGNDGQISVNVTGGTPPYTSFLWNTGSTETSIANLTSGVYTFQIIDSEGCIGMVDVVLEDPEKTPLDLEEDYTLCQEQTVSFDITVDEPGISYQWTSDNGFESSSPTVEISSSGVYTATITTSLGCVVQDEINVHFSDKPIDAQFLVKSQTFAFHEIVMVNVSEPFGDEVEWIIPDEAIVLFKDAERLILSFEETGVYDITIRTRLGDCFQDYTKSLIVEEAGDFQDLGDTQNPFIDEFVVYPNPSDGQFTVKIALSEEAPVSIRIVSILSYGVVSEMDMEPSKEFSIDFDLFSQPSGVYMLMLETPEDIIIRKIVIN